MSAVQSGHKVFCCICLVIMTQSSQVCVRYKLIATISEEGPAINYLVETQCLTRKIKREFEPAVIICHQNVYQTQTPGRIVGIFYFALNRLSGKVEAMHTVSKNPKLLPHNWWCAAYDQRRIDGIMKFRCAIYGVRTGLMERTDEITRPKPKSCCVVI